MSKRSSRFFNFFIITIFFLILFEPIPANAANSPEDLELGETYCILDDGQYAFYEMSNISNEPSIILIHWKFQTFEQEIPIQVLLFEKDEYLDWKHNNYGNSEEILDTASNGNGSYNTLKSAIWYLVFLNENNQGISTKLKTDIIYENGSIDENLSWAVHTSSIDLVPSTPSNLGYDADNNKITLHWSPSTLNGSQFNGRYFIFRANSSGDYIYAGSSYSTSFTDYDVINGQSYYYKVNVYPSGPGSSSKPSSIIRAIPENLFEKNAIIFSIVIGIFSIGMGLFSIVTFIDQTLSRHDKKKKKRTKEKLFKETLTEIKKVDSADNFQQFLWKLKSIDKEWYFEKKQIIMIQENERTIFMRNEYNLIFNKEGKLIESTIKDGIPNDRDKIISFFE
jgi:hypothetical protein